MSAVRVEPNLFDRLNAPSPCVGNLAWRRNVATYRDSRTIAILGNEINFQLSAIDIIQTAVLTILTLGLVWLAIAIYAHVRMADENSALSLLSLALNAPPSAPDRDTVKPDDESAGSGHSSIVAKNAGEAAKSEAVAGEDATGETSRSECEKVIQKSTPAAPSAPPPAIAPNAKSPIRTVPPPAPATVPPPAAAAAPPKAVAAAVPRKAPPAVAPSVATVSPTTATVAKKPPPKALPPAKAAPKPAKPRSRPPAEYAPGPVVPVVAIEKSQTGATVTRKSKSVAPPRNGNSGFESIYECANYFFGAQTEFTVGEARYPNAATMLMAAITSTAFPNVGLPKDLLIEGLLNPAELMVRAGDTARGGRFTEAFKEKIIGPLGSALKLPVDIALERITENPTLWNRFMQRLRDAQIMAMSSKNYRISISETLAATAGNGGKESAIAAIMAIASNLADSAAVPYDLNQRGAGAVTEGDWRTALYEQFNGDIIENIKVIEEQHGIFFTAMLTGGETNAFWRFYKIFFRIVVRPVIVQQLLARVFSEEFRLGCCGFDGEIHLPGEEYFDSKMSFAALAEWAGGVSDGGDINIKNDMTSLFRRIGIDANANCGPAMRLLLHATKRHAAAAVNFLYGEEGITTAELNFADGQPQPNDFPSTWKGAMTLSTLSECIVRRKDLHEWGGKSVWGALRIGKYSEEGAERLQCLGEYNAAKKRFLAPLEKTTVIYPKRNSRTAVAPT